ncbi:hypothetical protein [Halogeometricum sp. CBA1124]|uniref:hypothetical protein n=1 Tax=Halogeometricum sp. CBA1124 TaxID=2668071 RepID=UPI00142B3FA5|nr:hypothetical protein [Halogeometricum sp. CBA1124]MUV57206.1 hypothetical protein [Halogeometricum sp. CBA1124]
MGGAAADDVVAEAASRRRRRRRRRRRLPRRLGHRRARGVLADDAARRTHRRTRGNRRQRAPPADVAAYRNGVAVESSGTVVFYEWDRIAAVDRTADAVVLRRRRALPWSRLDARADAVDDAEDLVATLRALRD